MSLEAAIEKLTAAVEANTAAIANLGKAAGARTAASTGGTDTKKTEPKKTETKKAASDEDMRKEFGDYLANGAGEKNDRKANIQAILGHYEAKQITEIAADKRADALVDLKAYKDGMSPSWADAPAEEDEDDMLG